MQTLTNNNLMTQKARQRELPDPAANCLYYYNHKWQVLNEFDTSDINVGLYIYGNYIDETLAFMWDNPSQTIRYYLHDHLYSVVALTDGDGDVIERAEYDAYGRMTKLDPDFSPWSKSYTWGNPYYFTGRELEFLDWDDTTKTYKLKLMYYRNRYYDTEMGRFPTQDPLRYVDGMNLYEYVKSAPIRLVDFWGMKSNIPNTCPYGIDNFWKSYKEGKEAYDKLGDTAEDLKLIDKMLRASTKEDYKDARDELTSKYGKKVIEETIKKVLIKGGAGSGAGLMAGVIMTLADEAYEFSSLSSDTVIKAEYKQMCKSCKMDDNDGTKPVNTTWPHTGSSMRKSGFCFKRGCNKMNIIVKKHPGWFSWIARKCNSKPTFDWVIIDCKTLKELNADAKSKEKK